MDEQKNINKNQDNQVLPQQLVDDVKLIVEKGLREAYRSVNTVSILTYWNVGKRIVEEEQHGESRATYGKHLIDLLSHELSILYPKGYSPRNLRDYRQFYLLPVTSDDARFWYVREASSQSWSVRTLARNVGSQYYHRLLQSPKKEVVINEMLQLTKPLKDEPQDFLKDPVVAEFLQLPTNAAFTETELEKAIIRHLKEFLLEMGRGFAFMAEQYHISTDAGDFFVDLVFYNVVLKCYVLIDLKTKKLTHQDVGQMDMYVRMFDDLKRTEGDNPTIGLLLCSDTSKDIAKYSVLHDNKQLFAAKYLTYLPTEDVLRREIEQQKELFYLQHNKNNNQ